MTAQDYIESRVIPEFQDRATVIGLFMDEGEEHWWVVYRDRDIPTHVYVKISEDWE